MAKCEFCKLEMLSADDCPANRIVTYADGEKWNAIPFYSSNDNPEGRCHDCNILSGNFHHPGCDKETCPRCAGQLLSCDCPRWASLVEQYILRLNEADAQGEIKIERSPFGVYIYVNGKCLLQVDLFYLSDAWKEQANEWEPPECLKHGSDFPAVEIYSGKDTDDPFASVRWLKDKVVLWSDHPDATAKAFSHQPMIQTITIPKEIEGEADDK